MLFLLSILAAIAGTGVIDDLVGRRQRKLKEQPKKLRVKNARHYKKIRLPNNFKIPDYDIPQLKRYSRVKILEIFEKLSPHQREVLARQIQKHIKNGNWKLKRAYEDFLESVNRIMLRADRGAKLNSIDKRIVGLAIDLLIPKTQQSFYVPIYSSWLISAKYNPRSKLMWVKMVRGKRIYKFPNVPPIAYLALISCKNHAGTFWWRKNYWLYSTNWKKWQRR